MIGAWQSSIRLPAWVSRALASPQLVVPHQKLSNTLLTTGTIHVPLYRSNVLYPVCLYWSAASVLFLRGSMSSSSYAVSYECSPPIERAGRLPDWSLLRLFDSPQGPASSCFCAPLGSAQTIIVSSVFPEWLSIYGLSFEKPFLSTGCLWIHC